jgi:hypothetical protein
VINSLWWWIEVHTGTVNEAGPYYGFFSGFGSDLGELTIAAGLFSMYWKRTCHEPRCWRPGHLMADGHTRSCWNHHPEGRPRRGHVLRAHQKHQERVRHDPDG